MRISLSPLLYWFFHLWVVGMSVILLVALLLQFAEAELPCPLCMLQRYCMFLSTLGPLWIILQARRGEPMLKHYHQGLALAQLGAILGAVISARQDLLHILPDDPGYGLPFLGLHLYSWAFLSFCGVLLVCGGLLLLPLVSLATDGNASTARPGLTRLTVGLFLFTVAANIVMMVFLEGFAWVLPDDPVDYHLLQQLRSL